MQRLRSRFAVVVLAAAAGWASGPAASDAAVVLGQVDTFEGLTTQNWTNGSLAADPIVLTGGPAGATDHYMQVSANGGISAGGKLTVFNRVQWLGNYITAGVGAIAMDLKNNSTNPNTVLRMRIGLKQTTLSGAPGYVTTNPFVLPVDGQWHTAVFGLSGSDLTGIGIPLPPLSTLLANPAELRILHSLSPALNGDTILAAVGIDNIAAIALPTPTTWTGNGGAGNARWDVAGNWWGNSVPANADVTFGVAFNDGNTIDLNGNRSVQGMTFTNTSRNNLTFTNGTLSLTGIAKRVGNGSVTFGSASPLDMPVNIAGGATIENNVAGGQISFNGNVSLQGTGVTFTGVAPTAIGGVLNDNLHGVTVNGTLTTSNTILAASIDGSGSTVVQAGAHLAAGRVGQAHLTIGNGAVATILPTVTPNASSSTSRVGSLSIDGGAVPTGTLDLNNNSLVIDYTGAIGTKLSDVTAQIKSGRNGKDANDQSSWNGTGIITGAGRAANVAAQVDFYNLGAINNADLDAIGIGSHLTTFAGQAVTPNTVLVKYTYSGDANLDGVVDGDDYTYWLNGFLGLNPPGLNGGWVAGDFDYNGVVDGDDYTQWLNSFLFAGPPLAAAVGGSLPVPEPSSAALISVAVMALLGHARLRKR